MTDPVTVVTPPVVELTQEQKDEATRAKFRAQDPTQTTDTVTDDGTGKPQRPADIPEKFWDAEKGEVRLADLVKSYTELEKKGVTPPVTPPVAQTPEEIAAAAALAATPEGLLAEVKTTRAAMTAQLEAGEPITDAQYAVMEKVGIDRETVDAFIASRADTGKLEAQSAHTEVGGEAVYKSMIEWAKTGLTPAECSAYDRDVSSRDPAVRLNAVRGLKARFTIANGTSGRSVTDGGGAVPGNSNPFKSKAEMVAAMSDPKYAKDSAFRDEVAKRVHAAYAAGINLQA